VRFQTHGVGVNDANEMTDTDAGWQEGAGPSAGHDAGNRFTKISLKIMPKSQNALAVAECHLAGSSLTSSRARTPFLPLNLDSVRKRTSQQWTTGWSFLNQDL
jgi:hypothetical protein